MPSTSELPRDPALPGLEAVRTQGLEGTLPEIAFDGPAELRLIKHVKGSRAVFEGRAGSHRFALKFYADDPTPEANLYRSLAALGLANGGEFRVPRLLGIRSDLRMLTIEWLDGRPLNERIKQGEGERAGERAATWLRHACKIQAPPGRSCGPEYMLYRVGISVWALRGVDRALGAAARDVALLLARFPPVDEGVPHLVHGTLYARHILDRGDGLGVIDWERYGQGPPELDAGIFLASVTRLAARCPYAAPDAVQAEGAFLEGTQGVVDRDAMEWYWSLGLLLVASGGMKAGRNAAAPAEASAVLREAGRHASVWLQSQGSRAPLGTPASFPS